MNYDETVSWMFAQLPMYQQQGAIAYKPDLTNVVALCEYLGNPQENLKFIHVAGTNGKGSTSHMLASILQEAGYKTGLYTSPHLKDFRERIKIDGVDISREAVTAFVNKHKSFFENNALSFFEMSVGLAFDYFSSQQVDIAVVEVGLGGRLDATNIITPLVSVITNIGIDHTQFLGNTIELIASEKAGIIKPGVPVVIGEYTNASREVFLAKANAVGAEIHFASNLAKAALPSGLYGDYQQSNIKTVMATINVLQQSRKFAISDQHLEEGLLNVAKNTSLMGRWQQLNDKPVVICDTAHNSHGLEIVINQIKKQTFRRLHMVIGVVNDKDLTTILPLFPKNAVYYFCSPNISRGLEAGILQAAAAGYGLTGNIYDSVSDAYANARAAADSADFIFIGGSTFVVAEVL